MSPKEYMSQIRVLNAKLDLIEANIKAVCEERMTLRSAWPDGQPHGTLTGDPTAQKAIDLAQRLEGYEHEQRMLRSKLFIERVRIFDVILSIPDADCMRLLCYRYVNMLTWEEIAVLMHYTYQWVAGPLHSKALGLVEEILNKKELIN